MPFSFSRSYPKLAPDGHRRQHGVLWPLVLTQDFLGLGSFHVALWSFLQDEVLVRVHQAGEDPEPDSEHVGDFLFPLVFYSRLDLRQGRSGEIVSLRAIHNDIIEEPDLKLVGQLVVFVVFEVGFGLLFSSSSICINLAA